MGTFLRISAGFALSLPIRILKPDYSDRFHLGGYNRIQEQEAYAFYQQWISPKFPRFLVIEIQHPTPYYDDSYAVNSANMGPYGDAIETELIPYIEKRFRGIGQGWARFLYGGSTGGWEALAVQMFYPDHYNGTFAACPDPVDFRAYTVVDIYKDKNAYFIGGSAQARGAAGDAGLHGAYQHDAPGFERLRAGAGIAPPVGGTVGYLAGGVFTDGQGWLSGRDLGQSDWRDSSGYRWLLARAL